MDFLIGKRSFNTLVFRPITTRENSEKKEDQLVKYFYIENDRRVNTDSRKIVATLSASKFRWRNAGEYCIFHHYSLFFSSAKDGWR